MEAWQQWMEQQKFELFLTVQYGRKLGEEQIEALTRLLYSLMNKHWLAIRWWKYPRKEWAVLRGIAETGPNGDSHVHALLNRPRKVRESKKWWSLLDTRTLAYLSLTFSHPLRKSTGLPVDIDLKRIRSGTQAEVASYLLKDSYGDPQFLLFGE